MSWLDTYFARIDYHGDTRPNADVLAALHLAHATHIPFENIDVLLKRPIRLDLESLIAKMVTARRGGYCFEHNLLFLRVLKELGFAVTGLSARVLYRTHAILPRTHMLLLVDLQGLRWIADVGFGGEGLLLPMRLEIGQELQQYCWTYRIAVAAEQAWVLQSSRAGVCIDLYEFTLQPQLLPDYEMANYYISTHPKSRFVQTLTAQLTLPEVRHVLRNRQLVTDTGAQVTERTLADGAELASALTDIFDLRFEDSGIGARLLRSVSEA